MAKRPRHARNAAPPRQTRTRTRQNKGALVSDPTQNTQQLNDQLRALGLYAAPTLGDGNCLFRALSDQYYGSPSQHWKLREDICNFLEKHKQRYGPFVDDERGLEVHLRCMRQQGTYGGHLELTAFAHLMRRDVKVIQPGLVYVIEWEAGADLSPTAQDMPDSHFPESEPSSSREARQTRRVKKEDRANVSYAEGVDDDENSPPGAVYVAYHDWEHFSSVRNLTGPHSGLPCVVEKPVSGVRKDSHPMQGRIMVRSSSSSSELTEPSDDGQSADEKAESDSSSHLQPNHVPLPLSRSSSPSSSNSSSISLSFPPLPGYTCLTGSLQGSSDPSSLKLSLDTEQRSPKRTYEESCSPYLDVGQGGAKRTRSFAHAGESLEVDADADTPSLLASDSSSDTSSSAASTPAASPPPSMVIVPPTPVMASRPLTRRQRKALGLPKPRLVSSPGKTTGLSAGKIKIPGGRAKRDGTVQSNVDDSPDSNWQKNGSGRMDVRGFKELRI